jgi:MoaA/NifB/PqqE/SkfB family radical SAM enzyme
MSFLAYRTGRGPRPFSAAMAVTNRCNLRCVYCNTPYMDPKDLSFDQSLTVMDRLKDLGVSRLGIVGGEPLIKKDIGELVKEAKQRGFYITFNSNSAPARLPNALPCSSRNSTASIRRCKPC